jgi:hypothetical protein
MGLGDFHWNYRPVLHLVPAFHPVLADDFDLRDAGTGAQDGGREGLGD